MTHPNAHIPTSQQSCPTAPEFCFTPFSFRSAGLRFTFEILRPSSDSTQSGQQYPVPFVPVMPHLALELCHAPSALSHPVLFSVMAVLSCPVSSGQPRPGVSALPVLFPASTWPSPYTVLSYLPYYGLCPAIYSAFQFVTLPSNSHNPVRALSLISPDLCKMQGILDT